MKKGLLIINLGTPNSPTKRDVKKYLHQFLLDPYVITLPFIQRQLLVRGVIVPRRIKASSDSYRAIWMNEGSPLDVWTRRLAKGLSSSLGGAYEVKYAMRYQNPSIESALHDFKKKNITCVTVIPLFPQPANATTGSILLKINQLNKRHNNYFKLSFINQFEDHPLYIEALVDKIKMKKPDNFDHLLFSFHGLPLSHLKCYQEGCCNKQGEQNKTCYKASCLRTVKAVVEKLEIKSSFYSIAFQSRLGKEPWIEPYFTDRLESLIHEKKKRVLVVSPSFVADCVETLFELEVEGRELFLSKGGEKLDVVESLNDSSYFSDCLASLF